MKIDIKQSILIVDELHVESVCRDALTKSYTLEELRLTIGNLDALCKQTGAGSLPPDVLEAVSEIKELMRMMQAWMEESDRTLTTADYSVHRNVYPHPSRGTNRIVESFAVCVTD